jgi:hypothetical protein
MVIADCVLLNFTERREFYRELKVFDAKTPSQEDGNMDMITRV